MVDAEWRLVRSVGGGKVTILTHSLPLFALLTTAAFAATAFSPTAAARDQVVWQGVVEYTLTRDGYVAHAVPNDCEVYQTFNLADTRMPETLVPDTPNGNRTTVECAPSFSGADLHGRYPVCNTTAFATVQGAAVVVGYASCWYDHTDCVASFGVPCAASVSTYYSIWGGCGTWLATGVKADVHVTCTVTIAWI